MNYSFQPIANLRLSTLGLNIYRNGHGEYIMQDVQTFRLTEPMSQGVMQNVLGILLSSDDEPLQFAPEPEETPDTPGDAYIAAQEASYAPRESANPKEAFAWRTEGCSSNINFVKLMNNGELYVTFKSGDTYVYYDVTQDVVDEWYDNWYDGGSIGSWFNRNIKGIFNGEKVESED